MTYATVADGLLAELRGLFPTPNPAAPLASDVYVYDGDVPAKPSNRYVVAYIGSGLRESSTTDGRHADLTDDFQVTCVAGSPDSTGPVGVMVRWLQARVRDHFAGLVLDVSSTACGPIVHTLSRKPVKDESVLDRQVMYTVDEFVVQADLL